MTPPPEKPQGPPPAERPASSPAPAPAGRNLPVAIAVGALLAGLFAAALVVSDYAVLALVAVLVALGLLELAVALCDRGSRPATPVALVAGAVMLYGAYRVGPQAQALGLVLLLVGAPAWTLLDRHGVPVSRSLAATVLMTLWVPFLASFVGLLLRRPDGRLLVAATIALTVVADVAAYAFGRTLGRHRLAPAVSPAKTWEGFAGALATVLGVAALAGPRVISGLGVGAALLFGAALTGAATLGDLAESLIKRDLGVKDLGTILPGHGGIMDRVDAMIFTLPTAHLLLVTLGR